MKEEFCDAVRNDLGRGPFITWFTELSVLDKEIDHNI